MIGLIFGITLGCLIGLIAAVSAEQSSKKKRKQELIQQRNENDKKREYCEYFINQVKSTNSLNTLLNLHKLIWACGFRNNNLGPDKFGMFRTNDIIKMTPQEVYLGNIEGLFTRTLADWSNNPKEEYQIVLEQYRKHLISNLTAIRLSLCPTVN